MSPTEIAHYKAKYAVLYHLDNEAIDAKAYDLFVDCFGGENDTLNPGFVDLLFDARNKG